MLVHSLLLSLLTLPAAAAPSPVDDAAEVRGMTLSCPTSGWEWATDDAVRSMEDLKALGVNWIAIHPYASIAADGTVSSDLDPANPPAWITRPIDEAHRLGLHVFVKPHIAHWGSPFDWRGEIHFDSHAQWTRFFETYDAWIVDVARIASDADAFAVGTELDRTVHQERAWRQVIADVRAVYGGHLTYGANWDAYGKVPFWDALDTVGIQAYFPLVDDDGAAPTADAIANGWAKVVLDLRQIHAETGKPIVFTELGYPRSLKAAHRPWEHRDDVLGEGTQIACMRTALKVIASEDAVVGAFLWKWFPGDATPRDFSMETPAMRALIRRHYERTSPDEEVTPAPEPKRRAKR